MKKKIGRIRLVFGTTSIAILLHCYCSNSAIEVVTPCLVAPSSIRSLYVLQNIIYTRVHRELNDTLLLKIRKYVQNLSSIAV